jgi:DNA-binding transcriptional regulator GbsR (MarR family)
MQEAIRLDTQAFRERWIVELDKLFEFALSVANPDKKDEAARTLTQKEQQMWAQIATRLGEVMANLTKGFDERKFNEDLAELERQVDEIKKLQTQTDRTRDRESEAKSAIANGNTAINGS